MTSIIKAHTEHKKLVHTIFQFFAYDMAETNGYTMEWDGEYTPPKREDLFIGGEDFETFIISHKDSPAGLIVLDHSGPKTYLKHFFILRSHRGKGIAKKALTDVFRAYKGQWYLSTFDHNNNAQSFWKSFLQEHGEELVVVRRQDDRGPEYHFTTV